VSSRYSGLPEEDDFAGFRSDGGGEPRPQAACVQDGDLAVEQGGRCDDGSHGGEVERAVGQRRPVQDPSGGDVDHLEAAAVAAGDVGASRGGLTEDDMLGRRTRWDGSDRSSRRRVVDGHVRGVGRCHPDGLAAWGEGEVVRGRSGVEPSGNA